MNATPHSKTPLSTPQDSSRLQPSAAPSSAAQPTLGLLTFHSSHNCGSMLQAYALQTLTQHLGYHTKIIDFSNRGQQALYAPLPPKNSPKNILKNLLLLPHLSRLKQTHQHYQSFLHRHLQTTTQSYQDLSELSEDALGFDLYLCGSDQIWNITIADGDNAYFLPFVKNHKKIAYAPSFGAKNPAKFTTESTPNPTSTSTNTNTKPKHPIATTNPATDLNFYRQALSSFDFLSIRENNGQKWLQDLTGRTAPVVLDPTLVVDPAAYSRLEHPVPTPDHYIFYYAPGYRKDLNHFVSQLSQKYHLPVIVFNSKQFYVKRLHRHGFILPAREDPGVYLHLMKHADLVCTTSFHGTIFASLYQKNFWILKNGGMYGDDDRVKTLIHQLHLTDRLIVPSYHPHTDYLQPVNYQNYRSALASARAHSFHFLATALKSSSHPQSNSPTAKPTSSKDSAALNPQEPPHVL